MSDRTVPLILATAGHVDHGKSGLVRALTGTDPDRLPEEKSRGMTIQLGFASLDLPSPDGDGSIFRLGVIDVPGHEDFVRNMVAGVGSVDAALLVVAADDGWMPQTEEHLHILSYLGVRRGLVALSKADLVADVPARVAALAGRLEGTFLAGAPIVPTCAPGGDGLDALRAALANVLAELPARRDGGKPRLPIDRVFTLPGVGTVVTGTLAGGALRIGQTVVVQPAGAEARVRSVQSHGRQLDVAAPGSRVALNLAGVRPGAGRREGHHADDVVLRGQVVTVPGLGEPTRTLDVLLLRLDRGDDPEGGRPPRLRHGQRVHVHHGATSTTARVHLAGAAELAPGERALAQLRLDQPLLAFGGDRLVVRDASGRHTLAGGLVLDCDAPRRDWKRPERLEALSLRAASGDAADWLRGELRQVAVAPRTGLLVQTAFTTGEVDAAVQALAQQGALVPIGDLAFAAEYWQALRDRAAAAIDAHHARFPEQSGMPLADVRAVLAEAAVAERVDPAQVSEAVVAALCSEGFARNGAVIRRAAHHPSLPPRLAPAGQRLRGALAEDPFNPPSRAQLAPDTISEQALRFLIVNGEVVELARECVMTEAALALATQRICADIAAHGPATVSRLKTLLGSTRRTMVPLLEHLDRTGILRRQGDVRTLGSKGVAPAPRGDAHAIEHHAR